MGAASALDGARWRRRVAACGSEAEEDAPGEVHVAKILEIAKRHHVAGIERDGSALGDVDVGTASGCADVSASSTGVLLPSVPLSGVVMGFLHSTNPAFGRAPRAARWILMELGLLFFMAGIGMEAGPSVVEAVASVGPQVLVAGLTLGVVPFAVAFSFGRHVLKMNDALLLGAMTGALTSTAALGRVSREAESDLPALGYAGTYPFANILLALAGSILIHI
jgi:putative transport protein